MDIMDNLSINEKFMMEAIELAKKGALEVSPNPMVGAIIVKDGQNVGQGFHQKYGGPHAEVLAIESVKNKADLKGATLYVTLEPCRHTGKTPPCWDLIQGVGIARVVCGSSDPFQQKLQIRNPKPACRSHTTIEYLSGLVAKRCEDLNKFFFTWITQRRPYITVKMAMSDDQVMAGPHGEPVWFTNTDQDKEMHEARALHQAIMVSATTVINDDCQLNVRHVGQPYYGHDPKRIIVDSKLRIPLKSKVLKDDNHLIIVTKDADVRQVVHYQKQGINLWICPVNGQVDLPMTFEYLASQGISSLLIEPGPTFYQAIKKTGLIDKLFIYWSNDVRGEGLKVDL